MTADEIRLQLAEAVRGDKRAAAVLKKIAEGKADFTDTMTYSLISGRLTGRQLAEVILEFSEGRAELAEALLRDRCEDINAKCAAVQTTLDEKQGVHLAPRKAAFPTERAATFAHSLTDPTVSDETIKRRARNVSENITVTFHDDFIKENVKFRDRLGLKCYVERTTVGDCCPWCSGIAGRYEMRHQPPDLFGRHDNCDCIIVYDGQVLRGQLGENGRRGRKWAEDKPKVKYTPPKRFSREEAKEVENRLLFASKPGKDDSAIADMDFINSRAFADKFKGKYENADVENAVVNACRQLVKNRNGTFYEEAFFIDAKTGKTVSYVKIKQKNGVNMPKDLKKYLTNAREKSIIMIHNNPNSSPFSTADFITATGYSSCYEAIACGHNGDVYSFRNTYQKQGAFLGYLEEEGKKIPYYEGTRDYYIAFAKYRRTNDDFNARHLAWESTARTRGFEYERR